MKKGKQTPLNVSTELELLIELSAALDAMIGVYSEMISQPNYHHSQSISEKVQFSISIKEKYKKQTQYYDVWHRLGHVPLHRQNPVDCEPEGGVLSLFDAGNDEELWCDFCCETFNQYEGYHEKDGLIQCTYCPDEEDTNV